MIYFDEISLATQGFSDIMDITDEVEKVLKKSGISEGLVTISVPGSTAGVTTIEFEPGLVKDLKEALERIAPANAGSYSHDRTWGDGNGFSHIRAALIGASKSFPVKAKKMMLGTWQQIVLIDFDNRHRRRKVTVQVLGE
ncbi:MAG: YjbQ family protein [Endomicrobiales bacterium]|nr:YjbQ family protein [Endomicrobiales bacterium]